MEVYVDCMPLADTTYLVYKRDKSDNTFSLIGFDNPSELSYANIPDIRDYYVGVPYEVCDDEEITYEVIRLK